ncbi:MAG: hypothetical protein NTY45_10670 [Elusimicrobia bacterium]|nr:hypothetical protein [Elusimicrobiota bacterium]
MKNILIAIAMIGMTGGAYAENNSAAAQLGIPAANGAVAAVSVPARVAGADAAPVIVKFLSRKEFTGVAAWKVAQKEDDLIAEIKTALLRLPGIKSVEAEKFIVPGRIRWTVVLGKQMSRAELETMIAPLNDRLDWNFRMFVIERTDPGYCAHTHTTVLGVLLPHSDPPGCLSAGR